MGLPLLADFFVLNYNGWRQKCVLDSGVQDLKSLRKCLSHAVSTKQITLGARSTTSIWQQMELIENSREKAQTSTLAFNFWVHFKTHTLCFRCWIAFLAWWTKRKELWRYFSRGMSMEEEYLHLQLGTQTRGTGVITHANFILFDTSHSISSLNF